VGPLSAWLVKHGLAHRSVGFDYQGIDVFSSDFSTIDSISFH
jgi:hypothetical protein